MSFGRVLKDLILLGLEDRNKRCRFAWVLTKKAQVPTERTGAAVSSRRPEQVAQAGEAEPGGPVLDFSPSVTETRRA